MQMVERPWGVSVLGTATVAAKPDVVLIRFRVNRFDRAPAQAFAAATEAVAAVLRVLREHEVPDEAVERSQLDLRRLRDHLSEVDGYQCGASFSVRFGDLGGVQRLLVDLIAAGADEIDGLDFDVSARAELLDDARRQAVAAGRRRAQLYADAAGVRLGAVLHLEDLPPDRFEYAAMSMESTSAGRRTPEPGQVTVSAAVMMGFAIEQG